MRFALVALVLLAGTSAQAQAPLEPGTRVRIVFAPDEGPGGVDAYAGVLRSVGDTLVVETDAGPVLRPRADALAALEVSAGRRPFPIWLIGLGTAAGLGTGYALAQTVPLQTRCWQTGYFCTTSRSEEYTLLIGIGTAVGVAASTYAAVRLGAERWVPAGELRAAPGGVSWRLAL